MRREATRRYFQEGCRQSQHPAERRLLSVPQIDQRKNSRRSPTIQVQAIQASRDPTLQDEQIPSETRKQSRRERRRPRSLRRPPPSQQAQARRSRWRQEPRQSRRCQIRRSRKKLLKDLSYDTGRVSFYENQTTIEIKKHVNTYINTFGHCADPALPDWKNALNYVASSPATVFFKRVTNTSCHVLCKNPPRGAIQVIGIGLKFCIKKT